MGLDITAYQTVKLVKTLTKDSPELRDDPPDGHAILYVVSAFAEAADGFPERGLYLVGGEEHRFRVGYGGHYQWRERLAELVGTTAQAVWKNPQPGPFVELINNSDCEGTIGPHTSTKLVQDFEEYGLRAKNAPSWFWDLYKNWNRAFHIAAGAGAVELH